MRSTRTNLRKFRSSSIDTPSGADFDFGNTTMGMPAIAPRILRATAACNIPFRRIRTTNPLHSTSPHGPKLAGSNQGIITWLIRDERDHICRGGNHADATGWLILGPNGCLWIRGGIARWNRTRRTHEEQCKNKNEQPRTQSTHDVPCFGALVRR